MESRVLCDRSFDRLKANTRAFSTILGKWVNFRI